MKLSIQTDSQKLNIAGDFTPDEVIKLVSIVVKAKDPAAAVKPAPLPATKKLPIDKEQLAAKFTPQQIERPRVLPKINDERTLTTRIGENEAFKKLLDQSLPAVVEEKRDLAVMADDAPPLREKVNVQVNCDNCGHHSKQTAYFGNRYIKCERCSKPLMLQPAQSNEWGALDPEGNTYRATKVYRM